MKLKVIVLFIFIIFSNVEASDNINKFVTSRNCNRVNSKTVPRYVPYEETYETRNFFGFKKLKTRVNYKVEHVEVFETESMCCIGYDDYESNKCIPHCNYCDPNSVCTQPYTCTCNTGYQMDLDSNKCMAICLHNCVNGYCAEPNICACNGGYRMLDDLVTCVPTCNSCAVLEYCVEPHVCQCINGYNRLPNERLDHSTALECKAVCDRDCVNADCVEPNLCKCHAGYDHLDEDTFTCEPVCNPTCYFGDCTSPGICTCYLGHKLKVNSSHICEPFCTHACVNGKCSAPETCICNDGYNPSEKLSNICEPFCSIPCTHGHCLGPEICSCDPGYSEENNNTLCKPICTENCVMGNCTAPNTCTCFEGFKLSNESKFICEPVCNYPCINGYCSAPNECACNQGYEKKNSTEKNPKCTMVCECANGYCNENNSTCETCAEGYHLVVTGNSTICQPYCEGGCDNGLCVEPEKCKCNQYYRADKDSLGNVVCVHACGGECLHGECIIENGTCHCFYGWSGKYCEEAIMCAIIYLIHGYNYDEYVNVTRVEEPWTGPTCNSECLKEIPDSNETKCFRQFFEDEFTKQTNLSCLLHIDSPCNTNDYEADMYKAEVNVTAIAIGAAIMLIVITITITVIVLFKRRKNLQRYESTNSVLEAQKKDQDCLIVNEVDSISL